MNSPSLKIIRSIFAVIHSCGLFLAAFSVSAQAQESPLKTERYSLKVETLASGLVSPWSVALLPDGLILVTEKPGSLRVLRDGKLWQRRFRVYPKSPCVGRAVCSMWWRIPVIDRIVSFTGASRPATRAKSVRRSPAVGSTVSVTSAV